MQSETNAPTMYLPPEALQGEEVPAFAKWKDYVFQKIEIEFSQGLQLKEVYNVAKDDWTLSDGKLSVTKPEVNGYIGLLFDSTRLPKVRDKATLSGKFYGDEGAFEPKTLEIELYRPLLSFNQGLKKLIVDPRKSIVATPLVIRKTGDGTVLCWLEAEENGEVQVDESEAVRQFREGLVKDVKPRFEQMWAKYDRYEFLLRKVLDYLTEPPAFEDKEWVKGLRACVIELRDVTASDEAFKKELSDVVGEALLKNLHLINYFEQLKEYLTSIHNKRILLQNPVSALKFPKGESKANLMVQYTDLTLRDFPALDIKLELVAKEKGEIPIYRLLQWE